MGFTPVTWGGFVDGRESMPTGRMSTKAPSMTPPHRQMGSPTHPKQWDRSRLVGPRRPMEPISTGLRHLVSEHLKPLGEQKLLVPDFFVFWPPAS